MTEHTPPPTAGAPSLTVVGAAGSDADARQGAARPAMASPLERYLSAEFDSEALFARVAEEAGAGELPLTAVWDHNSASRNLTPEMDAWLQREVAPLRTSALGWLNAQAHDIKIDSRFDGFLLPSELDRIEIKREQRVKAELERFNNRRRGLLNKARDADTRYRELRAELGGREAQTPGWLLELAIFLGILLPESWLNFESFRRAPMVQSDAMAVGITIIIGAAIAIAAYLVGLFLRQLSYYLKPLAVGRKKLGMPLIVIGSILLVVSLAAVGYARYYYLLPLIEEAEALGMPVPSMVVSIGGLLLGNLLCFLIGAGLTFLLHDPNPEYAEAAKQSNALARKVERLRGPLQKKIEPIEERAREDREAAATRERQMHNRPGYQKLQESFANFRAKDAEVVSILNTYRSLLVQHELKFTRLVLTADLSDPVTRLSARQYAGEPIALHCA